MAVVYGRMREGALQLHCEVSDLTIVNTFQGQISMSDINSRGTVMNFLRGGDTNALIGLPPLSLHSRAAVLFTHASWLASKYKEG